MTTWYLDTSAALKLVLTEAESPALIGAITAEKPRLVACQLLETEVRRAAHRASPLDQQLATSLLDRIDLYQVTPAVLSHAGLLPGEHLRSLDAIHVAAAVAIGVDHLVTYDHRMADAARSAGISVLQPS
ncbi:MAG: type II toxin-antitoxin system VapC family toxin [Aeromicrobium sp.]|uniref:type II toxin-antitoxin system VapC family toxin n=1 Tax=Aeromicrobium sp. TaxID=1871063 RepID=UPI0039E4FBF6